MCMLNWGTISTMTFRVSPKTPKRLGMAGVRAEVGGFYALSAVYHTLTGKSGNNSVLSQFFIIFGR